MRTLRRLEVFSGFIYFVSTLAYLYFVSIPFSKGIAELYNDSNQVLHWGSPSVIIGILLHLTIPISAYFHAFRNSYIALGILFLIGSLVVLMLIGAPFVGSSWPDPIWISVSPAFFAFTTILLAGINTIMQLQHKQNL